MASLPTHAGNAALASCQSETHLHRRCIPARRLARGPGHAVPEPAGNSINPGLTLLFSFFTLLQ